MDRLAPWSLATAISMMWLSFLSIFPRRRHGLDAMSLVGFRSQRASRTPPRINGDRVHAQAMRVRNVPAAILATIGAIRKSCRTPSLHPKETEISAMRDRCAVEPSPRKAKPSTSLVCQGIDNARAVP